MASLFFLLMSHVCLIPLSTPTAIINQEDRVITILAGQPDGKDWNQVHEQMSILLEQAGASIPGPHNK
jgi:predicted oxidoreductase (fatty acid repression mutant protein)